jgi:hypothetical protein
MLEHAISNNIAWYEAVTGAHGIRGEIAEHYWSSAGVVPPYYSNLVTRTVAGTRVQLERIRELAAAPPKPDWSLKDSFARLDLEELGLRVLFDAQWYGLDAGETDAPETDVRFTPVLSADELARWEAAWQRSSPAPGLRIFPSALLADPDIVFLAAVRGTTHVGGAATNLSDGAVGLSNFYALGESAAILRDCARHVRGLHRDRAVVGYGPESELEDLARLGFRDLGPLRVWAVL